MPVPGGFPVAHDDATSFDEDLELAYRRALEAVDATDLTTAADWRADDEPADILPFPGAAGGEVGGDNQPIEQQSAESVATPATESRPRVTPRQILEAAVFVGGIELTGEKLAGLLKGDFSPEFVSRTLAELNERYAAQNRPYEIRCEENLYRLALRADYEPLRRRVYGLGPKEVKLSQDALEILSLIAYQQPLSRAEIESRREGNAGNVLRQLVRRQLVAVGRDEEADEMRYVTTARFLEVFGLTNLDELPQADELSFK